MNNSEENPTQKKKNTEHGTSVQTDSSADSPTSTVDAVEIQRRINELRGEFLDKRAVSIDRWLAILGIVFTFFGVVVAVAGYIGFTRFQEIETEAKGYVEEIKKNYDESVKISQNIRETQVAVTTDNDQAVIMTKL